MKKFIPIFAVAFICTCLFAQTAKSTGLTDSDVQGFCKYYSQIYTEMDNAGVNLADTGSFNLGTSAKSKVNKVLNKYGISGNNAYDKVVAIAYAYTVQKYDQTVASDPQTAALMKSFGMDPMAELRNMVSDADAKVVKKNYAQLDKIFNDELAAASSDDSDYDLSDYSDLSALMSAYAGLAGAGGYDDMTLPETKLKQDVLKKYDTKKKFNVVKTKQGEEWIIVQPTDITFANSDEAFIYAENYTGVPGHWEAASSFGYLGTNAKKGDKPLYVWLNDGVGIYKKFPVDFAGGAPDELIPNEKVTPDIAKKAILQMYKLSE